MQEKYLAKKFQWPALVVYDERYLGVSKTHSYRSGLWPFFTKARFWRGRRRGAV